MTPRLESSDRWPTLKGLAGAAALVFAVLAVSALVYLVGRF
jgi:hypothetical protein